MAEPVKRTPPIDIRIPPALTARELYEQGRLVEAARREADACDRDGYDITAAILRDLAEIVEAKGTHDG